MLIVQGRGGRGEMKFSNKKAGSQTPLQFELSEKHLKNCQNDSKFFVLCIIVKQIINTNYLESYIALSAYLFF